MLADWGTSISIMSLLSVFDDFYVIHIYAKSICTYVYVYVYVYVFICNSTFVWLNSLTVSLSSRTCFPFDSDKLYTKTYNGKTMCKFTKKSNRDIELTLPSRLPTAIKSKGIQTSILTNHKLLSIIAYSLMIIGAPYKKSQKQTHIFQIHYFNSYEIINTYLIPMGIRSPQHDAVLCGLRQNEVANPTHTIHIIVVHLSS